MEMEQVLMSVRAACSGLASIDALPHVASTINAFLFCNQWTLESASKRGFLLVMDRLLKHDCLRFNREGRLLRLKAAVDAALEHGYDVNVLEWWLKRYLPDQNVVSLTQIYEHAIRKGRFPVLEWLYQETNGQLLLLERGLQCNRPAVVIWMHEKQIRHSRILLYLPFYFDEPTFHAIKQCIIYQDQDSSLMLINTFSIVEAAIKCCQLDQVQWLYDHRPNFFNSLNLGVAVRYGKFEIVKWLYNTFPHEDFQDPPKLSRSLADHGSFTSDLDMIRWLLCEFTWTSEQNRLAWVTDAIEFAAGIGSLELLKLVFKLQNDYFKADRCAAEGMPDSIELSMSSDILDEAAANGHLDIIQWLQDLPCRLFTAKTMDKAAANGHLTVIQWLHRNQSEGCTETAMDSAAANGHLDIVQWLHLNRSEGCTTTAMDSAAADGHLEIVKWLHYNRTEGCTIKAMDLAAQNRHLSVVKWLHENRSEGCTTMAMYRAAEKGYLDVVQWLQENRREGYSANAVNRAAENGHVDVVRFLYMNREERCTRRTMDRVAVNGHFGMFQWLYEQHPDFYTPDLIDWEELGRRPNSHLKCLALIASSDRFDWIVNKFIESGQFETVESLLLNGRSNEVNSTKRTYVRQYLVT